MARPLLCLKEKFIKTFNPFVYSIVFCGLEIHNLSIGMTTKQQNKHQKKYYLFRNGIMYFMTQYLQKNVKIG